MVPHSGANKRLEIEPWDKTNTENSKKEVILEEKH
jgi:hypothetical protein